MGGTGIIGRDGLNERQRMFCAEYFKDMNVVAACKRAGYTGTDVSLRVQGSRLLKIPAVKKQIAVYRERTMRKVSLSRRVILEQLYFALTRKIKDLVDTDGKPLPVSELPDSCQSIIDGLEVTEHTDAEGNTTVTTKYKLTPHAVAREQALKHKGLFAAEKHEVDMVGRIDIGDLMTGSDEPEKLRLEAKVIEPEEQ